MEIYGKRGARIAGVLKFDISSFHGAAEVRKAYLRLYNHRHKSGDGLGGELSVFRPDGKDWSDDGTKEADHIESHKGC